MVDPVTAIENVDHPIGLSRIELIGETPQTEPRGLPPGFSPFSAWDIAHAAFTSPM